MNKETYEKDIITFLKNNILADGVVISAQSNLRESGIDSYSIVEIIFIERQYSYIIPDHLLKSENFDSVEKIAAILEQEI